MQYTLVYSLFQEILTEQEILARANRQNRRFKEIQAKIGNDYVPSVGASLDSMR